MSRSLIVMPDDGAQPILDVLSRARKSLRLKMFVFSDATLIAAVVDAHRRGVKVRVMLNPLRRSGEAENESTRKALSKAGVDVLDTNPAFDVTHEKSLVVDDDVAVVHSLNWEKRNLTETRDFAVVTEKRPEVAQVAKCFDADWSRRKFKPDDDSNLIWCNLNGRNRIARFIDSASTSLFLQNERYQDEVIIERLVRAAARGVKIHVLARPAHTLKDAKLVEGVEGLRILKDIGAKVHKLKGLKLHAKMMLADGERAIIGSINLAPGSFDSRRELAIEVDDRHVTKRLHKVAKHDWNNSRPLDLSDFGLLKDLHSRKKVAESVLAIDEVADQQARPEKNRSRTSGKKKAKSAAKKAPRVRRR